MKKIKFVILLCCIWLLSNGLCQEIMTEENQPAVGDGMQQQMSQLMNENPDMDMGENTTSSNAEPSLSLDSFPSDIDEKNDSAEVDELGLDSDDFALPSPTQNQGESKPSRFDGFNLPDIFTKNLDIFNASNIRPQDGQHIYKVPKGKVRKSRTSKNYEPSNQMRLEPYAEKLVANKTSFYKYNSVFQMFINMYDHYFWNAEDLARNISKDCADDLRTYLEDLKMGKIWALKGKNLYHKILREIFRTSRLITKSLLVSDASGRYNGLSFFDNDSWLGSKASCTETNRYIKKELMKTHPELPELEFVIIRVLATLNTIFSKVRNLLRLQFCP